MEWNFPTRKYYGFPMMLWGRTTHHTADLASCQGFQNQMNIIKGKGIFIMSLLLI